MSPREGRHVVYLSLQISIAMSTAEQSTPHVSVAMPAEQPATQDNFHFMTDTFTLPQDGQSTGAQSHPNQGYAAGERYGRVE